MKGSMMSGGMLGHGWIGGFSWVWIPTLLIPLSRCHAWLGDLRAEVTRSSVLVNRIAGQDREIRGSGRRRR
jgi:hypothetical protein